MKPVSHQYEDKLLEFAYGELPAHEASAVESHLKTCARCTSALDQIRSVRNAMSALPAQAAPDKGLDSLLAYAEQAARRNAEAAAPKPLLGRWMKWVAPLAGVTAVLLVGGVYVKASKNVDLSRESAVAEKVKASDDLKRVAPPSAAPVAAEDMAKAEPKALEEPQEQAADAIAAAKPAELKGGKFRAKNLPAKEARQRDDKEDPGDLNGLVAKSPSKVQAAPPQLALDQQGKGGGRVADTRNAMTERSGYQGSYGLGSELAKADSAASNRASLEKREASPKAGAKAGDDEGADEARKVVANAEPHQAKKKSAKTSPANNVGGGEIVNPTGAYADGTANKQEAPAAKKPAPVADKSPETVAANEAGTGASQWATQEEKKQAYQQAYEPPASNSKLAAGQAAQAPPPPPAQAAPGGPSRKSSSSFQFGLQNQRSISSAGGADEPNDLDVAGPPSATTKDLSAQHSARQKQLLDLMVQARGADKTGDTQQMLKLCKELLDNDAEGDLRAETFYRMCTGLQRIGREDQAQQYCDALQAGFPQSRWAAQARQEQNNLRESKPRAEKRRTNQYDELEKSPSPASPQPKQAPADAAQKSAY